MTRRSEAACRAVVSAAARGAALRARRAIEASSIDGDIKAAVEAGWMIAREQAEGGGRKVCYLRKAGVEAVRVWLESGEDASGRRLAPEERAALRPRYGGDGRGAFLADRKRGRSADD